MLEKSLRESTGIGANNQPEFPIMEQGTDLGAVMAEIYSRAEESHEAIHAQTGADADGESISMI